jgi:hypothetical protein
MSMNGLSDKDISLVDACYRSVQAKGVNGETCDEFKKLGYEWDTKIACTEAYKENVYYWTPRMMFLYVAGGKEEISSLGRKNKGSSSNNDPVYTLSNNMTLIEALNDRCGEMRDEPEYPIFIEINKQMRSGVKKEDLDLSMFEDRNLYGWSEFASWVVSSFNYVIRVALIQGIQYDADLKNYKACSVGYGMYAPYQMGVDYLTASEESKLANLQDRAECSGNKPWRCKRYHFAGPGGWWNRWGQGVGNQLNKACVVHDKCLQNQNPGSACDSALASAAWSLLRWKAPGISCSWRGCRTWWFTWRTSTVDSRGAAILVYCSMAWATPNTGKNE